MTKRSVGLANCCGLLCILLGSLLSACAVFAPAPAVSRPLELPTAVPSATPAPSATPVPVRYALIGKARGGYWDQVARGAQAAERALGLPSGSVVYTASETPDPAAQIIAMENFIARRVRGIAIAPIEARALELSIQQARAAGIWVITFDSDAPQSERLFFVGTSQPSIGRAAATTLLALLGERGGKLAFGSTWLDGAASARIAAFKDTLKSHTRLSVLDAQNDRQDVSLAAQFARNSLTSSADLVGAFGVHSYNGAVWCRALRARVGTPIALVAFDPTTENVECLKAGIIGALLAPRPFAQGEQSVRALDSLTRNGLIATATTYQFDLRSNKSAWQYEIGVDIVSLNGQHGISLAAYAALLDQQNAPRDWQP